MIKDTVERLRNVISRKSRILVVDDGSNDDTGDIARRTGVLVIRHAINRGLGGALGTGLYWAKTHDVEYAVTFDADGQHDPADIQKILNPLYGKQADVVVGSRTREGWGEIPFDRKIVIAASNLLTWWFFGLRSSDSLSGFRGFNRKAIEKITIKTDQMEVSNEFFSEIRRNKLIFKEVPIRVIYTEYSRSKGQQNSNAMNVGVKLLLRLFR